MAIFKGSGVALVTPMKEDGSVDYKVLEDLLEDQIANKTDAIVAVGTSGEAPTLDDDEHIEVIRATMEIVHGRIPVIGGTGSNNTDHAIMMTREAEKLGVDGVLLVTPYYNKCTQEGLYQHYRTIAESTQTACVLYNVPSRTGVNMLPQTMARLARDCRNIVAVKEASGNISQIAELAATPEFQEGLFDIYSGNDDQIVPICSLGGAGVISVLANVAPRQTQDMVALYPEGKVEEARKLQLDSFELCKALFCEVNPIPVKAGLVMQGFAVGAPRLPLTEMTDAGKARLEKAMKEFGIL